MVRKHLKQVILSEPITLGDLRWLIERCDGVHDDVRVQVVGGREYGQREYEPAQLTVDLP